MARIRTIKPAFFRHEALFELERDTGLPIRVAFAGLWTVADREGRFEWRPRQLKLDCLPYDAVDFSDVLAALESSGFIRSYEHSNQKYGHIPSWNLHQVVNQREAKSTIPVPPEVHAHAHACIKPTNHIPNGVNIPSQLRDAVFSRDGHACVRCAATSDLTVDHIFPQCVGGTHAITNLRTLCRSCNSARPVQGHALIADLAKDGLTIGDMGRICMHVHAHGEREGKGREQEGNGEQHAPSKADAKRGTRLPADWTLTDDLTADATAAGVPVGAVPTEAAKFRDYWTAKAGKDGVKLDWRATWRNWCRNAAERTYRSAKSGRHDLSRMKYEGTPDDRI